MHDVTGTRNPVHCVSEPRRSGVREVRGVVPRRRGTNLVHVWDRTRRGPDPVLYDPTLRGLTRRPRDWYYVRLWVGGTRLPSVSPMSLPTVPLLRRGVPGSSSTSDSRGSLQTPLSFPETQVKKVMCPFLIPRSER